jgi:hypothetical protein
LNRFGTASCRDSRDFSTTSHVVAHEILWREAPGVGLADRGEINYLLKVEIDNENRSRMHVGE